MTQRSYDVAIIGAGPVGCVCALAHAQRGARVLLLEANPRACHRLAGEWLHPPAVDILHQVGAEDVVKARYCHGEGFMVFPEDGSESIELPYRPGSRGYSVEHSTLVARLRTCCLNQKGIEFVEPARATQIDGQELVYQQKGKGSRRVTAKLIVGAAGRSSIAHQALGFTAKSSTYSRMAGVLLHGATLPDEGYGHVFLGGPGPVLAYRIGDDEIRLCMDVPLSMRTSRSKEAALWDAFRPSLPAQLHDAFAGALQDGPITWAANQTRPRVSFGREGLVLVGDAAGHHHPLTALGMTLGFQDAVALAEADSFTTFKERRLRESRVPEMLAVALYEVFADTTDEVVAIRHAVYDVWRADDRERGRTMAYLACQDTSAARFGGSFVRAIKTAAKNLVTQAARSGQWRHNAKVTATLADRCRWLLSGAMRFTDARPYAESAFDFYGAALNVSQPQAEVFEHPMSAKLSHKRASAQPLPHIALERAIAHLKAQQNDDGSWEGETVWNPMLPAQYVMMSHLTGNELSDDRRRLVLQQFRATQLDDGCWGMHELSEPYLFLTTLVYVAARLLGVTADDPLLARAGRFIADEGGAVAIPSWGKFWLALLGLYEWSGVNPVLPEVWRLPKWIPAHPSNYYCHTRLIYLAMASLYGRSMPVPDQGMRSALRRELFPQGYDAVAWSRARHELRSEEIFTPPSRPLKAAYDALWAYDKSLASETSRASLRNELLDHVRFEFRSTDHTCISPVNGMLNLLTLWLNDPDDADYRRGIERLEGWMWEDEQDGTRIAGARSATWDTSFALQALTAASPHFDVLESIERGDRFLANNQIHEPAQPVEQYAEHYRVDPTGGFTFAAKWHGWPVSDCTAEALVARVENPAARCTADEMEEAARFILRTECPQGGFGSYEPFRPAIELEWLNPAEMFGDSMTEHPYVECTASCVAALALFRERYPRADSRLLGAIDDAAVRAEARIRLLQRPDGAWTGNWGVHFIYGTLFAIRGLLACGVSPQDAAIRKACRWLKARQNVDGGWGESHLACIKDEWVADDSQVIQTAWAMSALLDAEDAAWPVIERAAQFVAARQNADGSFPKEAPTGVFFHTALLHYELYRSYFPLWALGQYESRRLSRLALTPTKSVQPPAAEVTTTA
jgi:squalene/oxidosqualene cyclase-like protein